MVALDAVIDCVLCSIYTSVCQSVGWRKKRECFSVRDSSKLCVVSAPGIRSSRVCLRIFEYKKEGRQTMGMLRVMSRRGDERVIWDHRKAGAGDTESAAAVREAERIFNAERTRGATAFKVESGKPVERIEQFDITAEQIVMVPRVVGG
jgi:hypothetical protein